MTFRWRFIASALSLLFFSGTVTALEKRPSWKSDATGVGRLLHFVDIDGDGWKELLWLSGNLPPIASDSKVSLFKNQQGVLEKTPYWESRSGDDYLWNSIALGDRHRDGLPDMVACFGQQRFDLYLNNGEAFDQNASWSVSDTNLSFYYGYDLREVEILDVNRDDWPDVIATWYSRVDIYLNDQGILPTAPSQSLTWSPEPAHPFTHRQNATGHDIDGDGYPEIAIGFEVSPFARGRNGTGIFKNQEGKLDSTPLWTSENKGPLAWARINSPASKNLLTTDGWYVASPGETLTFHPLKAKGIGVWQDLNGDGLDDFVLAKDHEDYVYLNKGGAVDLSPNWFGLEDLATGSMAVADVDRDGQPDVAAANYTREFVIHSPEHVSLYKGNGHFPPSGPAIVLAAGFGETRITQAEGGTLTIMALVKDKSGGEDVSRVEVMYEGIPTGVELQASPQGGEFAFAQGTFQAEPSRLFQQYLLVLRGRDREGWTVAPWPWLTIY